MELLLIVKLAVNVLLSGGNTYNHNASMIRCVITPLGEKLNEYLNLLQRYFTLKVN